MSIKSSIRLIILIASAFLTLTASAQERSLPIINQGPDGIVTLDSDWLFKPADQIEYKDPDHTPENWAPVSPFLPWQLKNADAADYRGTAWFRLNFKSDRDLPSTGFSLFLPYSYGPYQLYLNSTLLYESHPFTGDTNTQMGSRPHLLPIPAGLLKEGKNLLALRVGSTDGWGGFVMKLRAGPGGPMGVWWARYLFRFMVLPAIFLFLFLFFSLFYLLRRTEIHYLWIALINLSLSLFLLGALGFSMYLWESQWAYTLPTFGAGILLQISLLNFFHSFFKWKKRIFVRLLEGIFTVAGVMVLGELVLTGHAEFFVRFLYIPLILLTFLTPLQLLWINVRAIRKGVPYAAHMVWGVIILTANLIIDAIASTGANVDITFTGEGNLAMVLVFSFVLALRYSNTQKELEGANVRLLSLDRLKNDFLANTSHELRTPLNGIIGITNGLLAGAGGSLNAEQQQNLQMVEYSGKRLLALVNDILDFSFLKNREIRLLLRREHLHALVEPVLFIHRQAAEEKGIRLVNGVDPSAYVRADANRLQQILHNLIGNAVKFTEQGEVRIDSEMNGDELFVHIRDTGIGIDPAHQERIFESFVQADESISRRFGGTGLGLSISRQLVELHGGRIWLNSTPGRGSTFSFSLTAAERLPESVKAREETQKLPYRPYAYPHRTVQEASAKEALLPVSSGSRVSALRHALIVDDDPINIMVLKNYLELEGFRVHSTTQGDQTEEMVQGKNFDIIILDVMMPEVSGYEVCRSLRRNYSPLQLPVLLLTARNQPHDILAGFEAGANDYLVKPFDRIELIARVNTLVALRHNVEANRKNLVVQQELRIAQRIQNYLLPSQAPQCPGLHLASLYHPLSEVGGDFYDFIQISDSMLGILIADAAGHGIGAALLSTMLKMSFAHQDRSATDPAALLKALNIEMLDKMEDTFITALYALIDLEKKTVTIARGGHPPAVFQRAGSRELITMCPPGSFLGVFSRFEYQPEIMEFKSGDRLWLFTDGVLEARQDSEGNEAEVHDFILQNSGTAIREIPEKMLALVQKMSGPTGFHDDVTAIFLEFE